MSSSVSSKLDVVRSPAVGLLDHARFEGEVDGKPVRLFTLRNARGMVVCITNYGAKIEQVLVPDCYGRFDDVVLGYDSLTACSVARLLWARLWGVTVSAHGQTAEGREGIRKKKRPVPFNRLWPLMRV